jgi:hypothetical protein
MFTACSLIVHRIFLREHCTRDVRHLRGVDGRVDGTRGQAAQGGFLRNIQSTLGNIQSTVGNIQSTLGNIQSTLGNIQSSMSRGRSRGRHARPGCARRYFKEHSVNFREHSVNFKEHSVNFREHSVNCREHSVNSREHSVNCREHSVIYVAWTVAWTARAARLRKEVF